MGLSLDKLNKLAKKGDLAAKAELGMRYHAGQGVDKDTEHGLALIQEGVDKDNATALVYMGLINFNSRFVKTPKVRIAFKCFERAAQQNNTQAMWLLGSMYEQGLGCKRNYVKAYTLYHMAYTSTPEQQAPIEYRFWLWRLLNLGYGTKDNLSYAQTVFNPVEILGLPEQLDLQVDCCNTLFRCKQYLTTADFSTLFYRFEANIKPLAEQGYSQAQTLMGLLYVHNFFSTNRLSVYDMKAYESSESYKLALEWLNQAADKNNLEAIKALMRFYLLLVQCCKSNESEEYKNYFYKYSVLLTKVYEHSCNLPKRLSTVAKKDAELLLLQAYCLCKGCGCDKNQEQGFERYKLAFAAGAAEGMSKIGSIIWSSLPYEKNDLAQVNQFIDLMQQSAKAGYYYAYFELGQNLYYSLHRIKALDSSLLKVIFTSLKKAAECDEVRAFGPLARCYDSGIGCSINAAKALEFYKQAIEKGDDDGYTFRLGEMYQYGIGCRPDPHQAFNYYEECVDDDEAVLNIVEMYKRGKLNLPHERAKRKEYMRHAKYLNGEISYEDYYGFPKGFFNNF